MDSIDIDAIVDAKPEWTDAETIERLRADYADTVTCLNHERKCFAELLAEREAEIARLATALNYDHGHNEPCLMCGEPCNSLAGNPSLWALRLGNDGWHHVGCVNAALRELERLRVPPGADVLTMVKTAMCCGGMGSACDDPVRLCTCKRGARVLQQYGDERAAAASRERDAEIERLATLEAYLRNELRALRSERDTWVAEAREAALVEVAWGRIERDGTLYREGREAAVASMLSGEMVELAARAECDYHLGGTNSVWDSGLTNKESRRDCMRAVLYAVAAKLLGTNP